MYESVMSGNVAADCAISIRLENTNNKRTYISPSQIEFTLVDEITTDDGGTLTKTFVMISYNNCSGYIAFVDLTEDEIHQILDTFVVRE